MVFVDFQMIGLNPINLFVIGIYIYVHGYESGHAVINSGLPQGSIAGPLLLLLYKINLNQAVKFSKAHHLSDEASLLCLSNSIQKTKQTSQR